MIVGLGVAPPYGWSNDVCVDRQAQGAAASGHYTEAQIRASVAGQLVIDPFSGMAVAMHPEECAKPEVRQMVAFGPDPGPSVFYTGAVTPYVPVAGPETPIFVPEPAPAWAGPIVNPYASTTGTTPTPTGTTPTPTPAASGSFLDSLTAPLTEATGLSSTTLLLVAAGIMGAYFFLGRHK